MLRPDIRHGLKLNGSVDVKFAQCFSRNVKVAGLSRAAWVRAPQGCAKLVGTRGTWMHFTVGSAHEQQLKLIVLELDLHL